MCEKIKADESITLPSMILAVVFGDDFLLKNSATVNTSF